MNLLNFLGPASSELKLALDEFGVSTLEEYMTSREEGEMGIHERIAYHLGRVNLIAEIAKVLEDIHGEEE